MNLVLFSFASSLRLLVLAAALVTPAMARADDYAEVNQLLRSGRHADALSAADRYLVTRPRDPQMRFLRGVVQSESGRSVDAIATYAELVREYPELPEPYNNLGVLYAAQREWDKAREAFEMAIRANPGYATAYENLGDVYAQLARRAHGRALELDPSNASARSKLAQPAPAAASGRAP